MSVTTTGKPDLRNAGKNAIKRSTMGMAIGCTIASVAFAYLYNYRRYNMLMEADNKFNQPEARLEAYERAKKFKALRSFPGGVSGIKEYWSGAH